MKHDDEISKLVNNQLKELLKKKAMKNTIRKLFTFVLFLVGTVPFNSCTKNDGPESVLEKQSPEIAIAWIKMQQKLFVGTPDLLPHITSRTSGYVGLTLYESIVPGMKDHQSIASQLSGELDLPAIEQGKKYHWPASANAALSNILTNLLPHTTPALLHSVD